MVKNNNKKGFTLMELIVASVSMLLLLGSISTLLLLFLKWDNNNTYNDKVYDNNNLIITAINTTLNTYNSSDYTLNCSINNKMELSKSDGTEVIIIEYDSVNSKLLYRDKVLVVDTIENMTFNYENNMLTILINAYLDNKKVNTKQYEYVYYLYYKGVTI